VGASAADDQPSATASGQRPDAATVERLREAVRATFGDDDVGMVKQPIHAEPGCNSGKGNRMSFADVQTLVAWEMASGESEASWQAQELWNAIKTTVRDDADALRLSRLMRINQHHYLSVLSLVAGAARTTPAIQPGCDR
jgi:Type II restriction endonuclease (RE_Alw26IDE)